MLYNYTNASSVWADRTTGLLEAANRTFLNAYKNSSGVMVEVSCDPTNACDNDQFSFKAYLGRWLGKTSIVAPFTAGPIRQMLNSSARAAAQACSGGTDGVTCGSKWYIGGYDGIYGVGQELSGLEVIQALLVEGAPTLRTSGDVVIQAAPTTTIALATSTSTPTSSSTKAASPTKAADASGAGGRKTDMGYYGVSAVLAAVAGLAFGRVYLA